MNLDLVILGLGLAVMVISICTSFTDDDSE